MAYFNGKKNFLVSVCTKGGSGIIEADALPTENINKNAFYLVGGKYYKWMDNNDNLGTWVFKDELTIPDDMLGKTYYFGYSSTENDGRELVDVTLNAICFDEDTYRYMVYLGDEFDAEVYGKVGWYSDSITLKTIKITEEPTDQTFIAWLKDNATKTNANQGWQEFSAGGIIEVDHLPTENINKNAFYLVDGRYYKWVESGIWVFKDELSIPYEMYAKTYYFSYSSNGVKFNAFHFIDDLAMHTIQYANDETVYCVYDDSRRWGSNNKLYKTIEIHEMPTDETFIAWLNDNATKDCCWVEYVTSSVSSGIVGTWVFNDDGLIPYEMYGKTYNFGYYSNDVKLNKFQFSDDGAIHSISYANDETGYYVEVYDDNRGWNISNESYKTIKITEEPTDQTFIAWLKDNATKEESEYPQYNGKAFEGGAINEDHENVYFRAKIDEPIVVRDYFDTRVSLKSFGNAVASDVRKGKLFTSIDGYQTKGTYEGDIIESEEDPTKKSPTDKPIRGSVVRYKDKYYKYNETNVLVFKDELGANGAEELMSKDYKFEYSVNVPNVGKVTMNEMVFRFDGTHLCISYYGDEYSIDDVYDEQSGWRDESLKTIEFHEMPDDEAFTNWLFEVAMSVGSWTEYADTTSNAPIASETWVFNEELTNIDKPFENGYEDVACSGYMLYDKVDEPFNFRFTSIRFEVDRENGSTLSVYLRNSDTNGIGIYYIDNFTYNFRHGTITFTELPDDEVFLAWLKENATKEESVVGTWVFNDELTEPPEELRSAKIYFKYSVHLPVEDVNAKMDFINIHCFNDDGIVSLNINYYGDEGGDGYCADDVYVTTDGGWNNECWKTITILTEPTDQTFISWLKANATKQTSETTGATAYTAKSVDELPNDAPDGSMALVESDSLVGKWEWNETIELLEEIWADGFISCTDNIIHNVVGGDAYGLQFDNDCGEVIEIVGADGKVPTEYREIEFIKTTNTDEFVIFAEWFKQNATRISGGTSLYIRQNGEWVYEREAELSGGDSDADDSIVGTWVFNDELTMPDEMPIYFYCDYYANTNDGLKRMNEVYINFVDEENSDNFTISYYGDEYSVDDVYEKAYGWSLDSNDEEKYKTIKILTEPTDQTFIAWLKANATKQTTETTDNGVIEVDELPTENIDKGAIYLCNGERYICVDSVIGTWVFNETLTSGITVIDTQEKFEQWTNSGFYCELKGYALLGDEKVSLEAIYCVYFGSTFEEYEEGYIAFSETNDAVCYDPDEGWSTRTIVITEQPAPEVVTWLKANATHQGVWKKCNIAEGSMALVDSDSIVGKWEFKDNQSPLDFSMFNVPDTITRAILIHVFGAEDNLSGFAFNSVFIQFEDNSTTLKLGVYPIYANGEWDDSYSTFEIFTDPADNMYNKADNIEQFKVFIETNCNRLSGGTSLYIRQNGEWVYEREADMGSGDSDADDSIVGTWVFNDELTEPPEELRSAKIYFKYSVHLPVEDVNAKMDFINIHCFNDDGIVSLNINYYGDEGGDGYCADDVYVTTDGGWNNECWKTITILTEPTDQTFISWLKANATKQTSETTGATAYTAKSVDELPNDAPDGSMALVESDSLVGKWEWNETIELLEEIWADGFISCTDNIIHNVVGGDAYGLQFDNDCGEVIEIVGADGKVPTEYREIEFIKTTNTDEFVIFAEWFKQNATRISGGTSLYIRQNGEWVYEREAELSGGDSDADDSIVGTWVFNDELTMPDEMPIYFYCDYYANTNDGLKRMNEVYINFVDEENSDNFTISYYGDEYSVDDVYEKAYGWSLDSNDEEKYKTIKILTEPTDQTFIAWLKANATKQTTETTDNGVIEVDELPTENIDKGAIYLCNGERYICVDSVIGTWVFNETLTSGITVIDTQEKFEQWTNSGFYCELKGYALLGDEKVSLEAIYCVYFGSTFEEYEEGYIAFSETNDAVCYDPDEGWSTRTIVITEQPAPEVVTWLKANATHQGVWKKCNIAEGSMAIVESDSIQGEWKFNCEEPLNFDDLKFDLTKNTITRVWVEGYNDLIDFFNRIVFIVRNGTIEVSTDVTIYVDGEWDDMYPPFKFYGDVRSLRTNTLTEAGDAELTDGFTKQQFMSWLNTNAERLSGGTSLYIRQNGEWVYKGEVS